MKKIWITILFTCLIFNSLISQHCIITDNVIEDYTNVPLDFATIIAEDNLKKTYQTNTDSEGTYMLELPAKRKYTVKCSYLGFETIEKTVIIFKTLDTITLNFELFVSIPNLDTIRFSEIYIPLIDLNSKQFARDTIKKKKFSVSKRKK